MASSRTAARRDPLLVDLADWLPPSDCDPADRDPEPDLESVPEPEEEGRRTGPADDLPFLRLALLLATDAARLLWRLPLPAAPDFAALLVLEALRNELPPATDRAAIEAALDLDTEPAADAARRDRAEPGTDADPADRLDPSLLPRVALWWRADALVAFVPGFFRLSAGAVATDASPVMPLWPTLSTAARGSGTLADGPRAPGRARLLCLDVLDACDLLLPPPALLAPDATDRAILCDDARLAPPTDPDLLLLAALLTDPDLDLLFNATGRPLLLLEVLRLLAAKPDLCDALSRRLRCGGAELLRFLLPREELADILLEAALEWSGGLLLDRFMVPVPAGCRPVSSSEKDALLPLPLPPLQLRGELKAEAAPPTAHPPSSRSRLSPCTSSYFSSCRSSCWSLGNP